MLFGLMMDIFMIVEINLETLILCYENPLTLAAAIFQLTCS